MTEHKTKNLAFLENTLLLENLQGGIVYSEFEPPFHLCYATEGMARLSGYTQEEIITLVQMDIVHEEDQERLMEEVNDQFSRGDTFDVEYRLKRKDGSFVYVLDRAKVVEHEDGKKYIHCLLTDISEIKDMQTELLVKEEKLKIAMFQSGNVIFDLNLKTKEIHFSENFATVFEEETPTGTIEDIVTKWVHQEDVEVLLKGFETVEKEGTSFDLEIQINHCERGAVWVAVHLTAVKNSQNNVHSIIGSLQNIDEQHRRIEELIDLSQKDGLTGIYNRAAIEKMINDRDKKGSALVILDIDHFKQINDQFGHAFGDEILKKITESIKKVLPEDALFGRLGGDEFLIYLSEVRTEDYFATLLEEVRQQASKIMIDEHKEITVSLGAACATDDKTTFEGLYKRADMALYRSKGKGRNCFQIYEKM